MILRIIIAGIVMSISLASSAQLSGERAAWNSLKKQQWDKAHQQLRKSLRKDSTNMLTEFVLSHYFLASENPDRQVDSAYQYVVRAFDRFTVATEKERDRVRRFPMDSSILLALRIEVEQAAYLETKERNTTAAYQAYIDRYSFAENRAQAIELRNEVAYLDALKENTHEAFLSYINLYPESDRASQAKAKYDKLLFEDQTRDKRLHSFQNFLRDYPDSPYRKEAERLIFEISTAEGNPEKFGEFIMEYPNSYWQKRANDILYHLLSPKEWQEHRENLVAGDSLNQVSTLADSYLVPVLRSGNFWFMTSTGILLPHIVADEIDPAYLCGNITEDVVAIADKLVARNGAIIWQGEILSIDDLGAGFLLIETATGMRVIHKTGFTVGDEDVDDATVLSGKFIALKNDKYWSLWSLAGKQLVDDVWDEILSLGNVLAFRKNNNIYLATTQQIAGIADQQTWNLGQAFNEVKRWTTGLVWVKQGDSQGVFNQSLEVYIPLGKAALHESFFGAVATRVSGSEIYSYPHVATTEYQQVVVQTPWVLAKQESKWFFLDTKNVLPATTPYDTITILGSFAVGSTTDSIHVYTATGQFIDLPILSQLTFLPGSDSISFLVATVDDKKSVYSHTGQKLFTVVCDRVQYGGDGYFIIHKKEKKGLLSSTGKVLLPIEFDAIGTANNHVFSLLKAMKFGLYNAQTQKLIKPEYTKNIVPYTSDVLVAFKDGTFGFINWDNKAKSKFTFGEVRYWNDTVAMVKQDHRWMFYAWASNQVVLDNIKNYKLIRDRGNDKLAIVYQENAYGVIHSKLGTIIPINFSDIVNIGSVDVPLYFTEKHVEEASLFVVIYYNHEGKLLHREVYEHDEYEKIYCSGN